MLTEKLIEGKLYSMRAMEGFKSSSLNRLYYCRDGLNTMQIFWAVLDGVEPDMINKISWVGTAYKNNYAAFATDNIKLGVPFMYLGPVSLRFDRVSEILKETNRQGKTCHKFLWNAEVLYMPAWVHIGFMKAFDQHFFML